MALWDIFGKGTETAVFARSFINCPANVRVDRTEDTFRNNHVSVQKLPICYQLKNKHIPTAVGAI